MTALPRFPVSAGAVVAMCLGLGVACSAAESSAVAAATTATTAPKGATALFNGRDLSGWQIVLSDPSVDPKTLWSFHDGVLRLVGKPNGYLHTEQSYANYRLHVEWRWPVDGAPKSNSGVFIHIHGPDTIWPAGLECQLAAGNAGQLVGMSVEIPGAPIINKRPRAPKLAPSSEKPFGEWNAYDIVCRGDSVDLTVNGVHQNHAEKISVQTGGIGLQMEGYPVEFRHVWLEKL